MADNETSREDKQLAPSQRKLDKARSEGSVPRSRDVGHAFVLGTALIGLMVFGPRIGASTLDMLRGGLVFTRRQAIDPTALTQWLGNLAASALWVIVPCGLVLMTVGVLASGIPGGFHVSMKPASGNFAKVNEVMARYVVEPFPARAAVGVKELPRGSLVEADAILVVD